jgi:hypothetical protein
LGRTRAPATQGIGGLAPFAEHAQHTSAGAIQECDEHGWAKDGADPRSRERAFDIARRDPPPDLSPEKAVAEVRDVLDSIGDSFPECSTQAAD